MTAVLRAQMLPLLARIVGDVADLLVMLGGREPDLDAVEAADPIVVDEPAPGVLRVTSASPTPDPPQRIRTPGVTACRLCGVPGHNARSCGREPKGRPRSPKPLTEPATIVASSPAAVLPAPAPSSLSTSSPPPISSGRLSPLAHVATPTPRSRRRSYVSPHEPPPGWTVEGDRREELLALSELTTNRKC